MCSRNQWRSRTAETLFWRRPGVSVRSAGTAASARVRISQDLLDWADRVLVMEPRHAEQLRQRFGYRGARCLDIPDEFAYMDPDLIDLLEAALEAALADSGSAAGANADVE